ncbi:stalk domain-containing protein [Thermoanaerobacterium sp. DL9XJH110]|uniref:stalk domain-containing protein n=1 Tax=Thermoanaerobacterium sp. DL9XJH110 TaxID=3386643 RepID=UPI003BB716E5
MINKNLKIFIFLVLLVIFMFSASELSFAGNSPKIIFNSEETNIKTFLLHGKCMVPVKEISTLVNAKVSWNSKTKEITICSPVHTFQGKVNSSFYLIDGNKKQLTSRLILKNGVTYIHVRLLPEIFNISIIWDKNNNAVILNTENNTIKQLTTGQYYVRYSSNMLEVSTSKGIIWRKEFKSDKGEISFVTVHDTCIYVAGSQFYGCLDLTDGKTNYLIDADKYMTARLPPYVLDDKLIIAWYTGELSLPGKLVCYNSETGEKIWEKENIYCNSISIDKIDSKKYLVIDGDDNLFDGIKHIYFIDPDTGTIISDKKEEQ